MLWIIGIASIGILWWLVGGILKDFTGIGENDPEQPWPLWMRPLAGVVLLVVFYCLGYFEEIKVHSQLYQLVSAGALFGIGMLFAPAVLVFSVIAGFGMLFCNG